MAAIRRFTDLHVGRRRGAPGRESGQFRKVSKAAETKP